MKPLINAWCSIPVNSHHYYCCCCHLSKGAKSNVASMGKVSPQSCQFILFFEITFSDTFCDLNNLFGY